MLHNIAQFASYVLVWYRSKYGRFGDFSFSVLGMVSDNGAPSASNYGLFIYSWKPHIPNSVWIFEEVLNVPWLRICAVCFGLK